MTLPTTAVATGAAAVLGACVGSFLNVVIWRVPRGESVVRPPSHCPTCGNVLRAIDNVPVLSWLALRGRCRTCGSAIARRYPAVEAITAITFAIAAMVLALASSWWLVPAVLALVAGVIAQVAIRHDHGAVNRRVTIVTVLVAFAALVGGALVRALSGS